MKRLAMETSNGFMAYAPQYQENGYYLLPSGVSVMSLQYGFAPVQSVPEPMSSVMMLTGLLALGCYKKATARGCNKTI
jgi:hypothetical protein